MQILIDNKDLKTDFGIIVLDYTTALDFPAERQNERQWDDKSGVDKNLENIRFEPKEFVLKCYAKATTLSGAYTLVNTLVDYMYQKGLFVLSLRSISQGMRECFICERSTTLIGNVSVRELNSLYVFNLGLKDVNPNAVKYKTSIVGGVVTILYEKGQTALMLWGNGDRILVSNSGNYEKTDYTVDGPIDIIIDIDKNAEYVEPLVAEFSANVINGVTPQDVQFTDESLGTVEIWSWDFGDGTTSSEKNPLHTYTQAGAYTVTLQIFNSAKGSDTEVKINYITVRRSRILINDLGDSFLINDLGDLLLKD